MKNVLYFLAFAAIIVAMFFVPTPKCLEKKIKDAQAVSLQPGDLILNKFGNELLIMDVHNGPGGEVVTYQIISPNDGAFMHKGNAYALRATYVKHLNVNVPKPGN